MLVSAPGDRCVPALTPEMLGPGEAWRVPARERGDWAAGGRSGSEGTHRPLWEYCNVLTTRQAVPVYPVYGNLTIQDFNGNCVSVHTLGNQVPDLVSWKNRSPGFMFLKHMLDFKSVLYFLSLLIFSIF